MIPARRTKRPSGSIKASLLLIGVCALLILTSCRAGWLGNCGVAQPPCKMQLALHKLGKAIKHPFSDVDHVKFTRSTMAATVVDKRVKPATAATGKRCLTLPECRALALRNNLDLHVARMEELSKRAIVYSTKSKLLPHTILSGELSERDSQRWSYSDPMGEEGNPPGPATTPDPGVQTWSYGHERMTRRMVLEVRWSPTDAALAYYLSKSHINDRLKAHYQRVRVAQKLIGVVDAAFFRMLSLQQAIPLAEQWTKVRSGLANATQDLMDQRLGGTAGFSDLTRRAKRADLRLAELRHEYQVQRDRLASAMGLSPDVSIDGGFYVVGELPYPRLPVDIPTLEMQAVQNRPEAFQAGLNHLNAINDVNRTIVKYCPKITGFWKYTGDKDKYLLNHDWHEVGVMVYFDLVDWMSNHFENRATNAAAGKTAQEMGAIALGISSQVRRAASNYYFSEERLRDTDRSLKRTRREFAITEQRVLHEDVRKAAVREARANVLEDRIDRLDALGRAHSALAELFSQTGTNYNEVPPVR